MTQLTRWQPFREMRRMHNMLDRFMDQSVFGAPAYDTDGYTTLIPIDVYQTDEEMTIKATVPGLKADDIQISITGDSLSISGEIESEHEEEGREYFVRERRTGSFSRSMTLPVNVDADKATADFEDGVLTITLPKVEAEKPKTISVKSVKAKK
jgi:HSP20 family protein